jgi:hypothetical protein
MDEQKRLQLLEDNPALIDIDVEYNKIIDGFLERFNREYNMNNEFSSSIFFIKIDSREFSTVFSGPLVYAKDGFEKYTEIPDMITFFFTLAMRLPPGLQRDHCLEKVWEVIDTKVIPFCNNTNALYDSLIRMIDYYKLDKINNTLMLDILNNIDDSKNGLYCNMSVFTEYIHLDSMGQLLNRITYVNEQYKTQIIYSEILKGLRDDKVFGIPTEDIVSFFMTQSDKVIMENFDIDMLVNKIYIDLFKIGNLDSYIEMQNKNIEYQYSFIENESKPLKKEDITNQLVLHYTNLKKIFERLILLKDKTTVFGLSSYTIAYILIHVPNPSFFVYSSYEKLYNEIITCSKDKNPLNVWAGMRCDHAIRCVKKIIKLNPNINIPLELMSQLFNEEDIDDIIEDLRIGFARYALYVINKFSYYFTPANQDGYIPGDEYPEYTYLSFLDKLDFIFSEVEPVQLTDKNENDQRVILHESAFYKDMDLKGILDRTNEYIASLKDIKKKKEASKVTSSSTQ